MTASYGVEGFTAEHLEAFKRYGTRAVLIAYDRDDAGERAAASAGREADAREGIECFRIRFPRGMDANEYARKVTPREKSLGVLVRNAVVARQGQSAPAARSLAGGAAKVEPPPRRTAVARRQPLAAKPQPPLLS